MRNFGIMMTLLATSSLVSAASAESSLPIVDEPLELTIHLHWDLAQGYEEDYPVEQKARELTGIHLIDKTAGPNSQNSLEAINLLLAQGDMPDIVGGLVIKNTVNEYGPQGAFMPLNDLIDAHAPNIKALLDARPDIRKAITAYDGNIYYVPYVPDGKYGRAYYVRQDWLDRLGLERPDTVTELYDVLVAFRDGDPNGNGVKDEIPFFARDWEEAVRLVTLWDGRTSGSDTYHDFIVDDGRVVHPYAQETYRDGLSEVARWYEEGLIDKEVFTRGRSARDALLSADLGGMTHDWFASTSGYNSTLSGEIEGFNFVPFLPPKSISGKRIEEHSRIPVKPDGWAISFKNEHPVETIKYFDFWFTEQGKLLSNFGVEGEFWDMIDGEPVFKPEVLNSSEPVNVQLRQAGAQIKKGFPQDFRYEWQWTAEEAREGIALYDTHDLLVDQFLGVALTKDEQAIFDRYWPPTQVYMLERQQAWLLGTGDVKADWDDYIEALQSRGYDEVMTVMNAAYKRQYD
ncbi:extracellular solute-binding protein [Puniceibacterium confluentis]|uniref:extracellular solute-binding protein n=1 Tax=Puniceibacterium confluentis TaxID=1958944 RepID=UPI0011B39B91|nr:extracellular solute-binding protein [Puniceibacterium confluentis]